MPEGTSVLELKVHNMDAVFKKMAGMEKSLLTAWRNFERGVKDQLKMKSPVGSTKFRGNWDVEPRTDFNTQLKNRTVYAEAIVYGSRLGHKPWPTAGPKTSELGGRIWSNKLLENPPNVGNFQQTVLDEHRLEQLLLSKVNAELGKQ